MTGRETAESGWRSLQWWPAAAGIAFAAFVAIDLFGGQEQGSDLAPIVTASGLVYLAAAALGKPSASWLVFFMSIAVITAAKVGWIGIDASWPLLALAALFFAYGLWRGATRPRTELPLQSVAMLAFGAIAVATLYLSAAAGAFAVAGGLLGHAAWDVYHHRANRVVSRSMAEFCFVFDTLLAVAIIIATT